MRIYRLTLACRDKGNGYIISVIWTC